MLDYKVRFYKIFANDIDYNRYGGIFMYIDEIYAARDYIQSRYKNPIDVAIVLGSGLGPSLEVITMFFRT